MAAAWYKISEESGEQSFNLGQVSYQNKEKIVWWRMVCTSKSQYEFLLPSSQNKEEKTDDKKYEEVATLNPRKSEAQKRSLKRKRIPSQSSYFVLN